MYKKKSDRNTGRKIGPETLPKEEAMKHESTYKRREKKLL